MKNLLVIFTFVLLNTNLAKADTINDLNLNQDTNILTGEIGSHVINKYLDKKSQCLILLYDDGIVVIYNQKSGNLIGVNVSNDKIIIKKPNGKLILKNGK